MARDVYGSTLDSLMRNRIAEEDQDLRARTADQGYLAQLAGERTRGRAVDVQRELGLGELGTRERIAGIDAQTRRDVARIMGDTSISVAERQARAQELIAQRQADSADSVAGIRSRSARELADIAAGTAAEQIAAQAKAEADLNAYRGKALAQQWDIATLPTPASEATRMALLAEGAKQAATRRAAASRVTMTSPRYEPSAWGAMWEQAKSFPFPHIPTGKRPFVENLEISRELLGEIAAEGGDASQYKIDTDPNSVTYGRLVVAPPDVDYMAMYRAASAPRSMPSPRSAAAPTPTAAAPAVNMTLNPRTGLWEDSSNMTPETKGSGLWDLRPQARSELGPYDYPGLM